MSERKCVENLKKKNVDIFLKKFKSTFVKLTLIMERGKNLIMGRKYSLTVVDPQIPPSLSRYFQLDKLSFSN